ncbi:MAG: hypothetical protein J0I77_02985 [Rudaea sp.]|uniref:hypothetical protein n=1 Tax=unclassified Rudaea TaxID=2627037 RepID=UPI0010F9503F|nr:MULTISPECIES: hypothetical protein [unclassified Rudaea]MBN8884661.1 hypothetical protein [Rudaea sp.]MBR0343879.1 hypothetical protein [Rudaea sp.]
MKRLLRKSLAAAVLFGLTSASAFAQAHLSSSFDGTWWNPTQGGRGVLFSYIPNANAVNQGTLFAALYTYNAGGSPVWVTLQSEGNASAVAKEIPAKMFVGSGGSFGDDFDRSKVNVQEIGTAKFIINSCNSVDIQMQPSVASGLPVSTYKLQPFQKSNACGTVVQQCPATTIDLGNGQCQLPSAISGNLRLPKGKTYIVQGQVSVRAGGVLTVDPGVTVMGSTNRSQPNFIAVLADGQIVADGTREEPITFTGPEAVPGSWAGVVLAGRSICNDAPTTDLGCKFEAIPEVLYGGTKLDDNSGVLRYVRILWAGQVINANEELNGLTLCGVGSGTTLDYVQVHGGLDDAFEFFGGTVSGRHLVASQVGDDMFDFDDGYSGRLQFLLGWQGSQNSDQGRDSNGVESDNSNQNNELLPRTRPVISNLTMIGSANGNEGMRIRRGSGGIYYNTVVTGFADTCFNVDGASSAALTASDLTAHYSFVGQCKAGNFEGAGQKVWDAGTGNRTGDPMLNGWMPQAGSPLLSGGQAPNEGYFIRANYVGAFDGSDDWTRGWIYNVGAK